jgi:hypothetical protein
MNKIDSAKDYLVRVPHPKKVLSGGIDLLRLSDNNMSENFFNLEKKPEKNGNFLFIVVPIILLIVIFGLVIISQYIGDGFIAGTSDKISEERDKMISTFNGEEVEEESEEGEEVEENLTEDENKEVENEEDRSFSWFSNSSSYDQVAERGEGLTHLARKAVTSYMTDNDVNLTDEQRIYVEDYVQKELQKEKGTTVVEVGESVDISSELLENAISNANDLTAEQLSNLSQYTAFVSF